MDTGKIFLSVRFWHPFLSADEIVKQIQKKPAISQNAGEYFTTPRGRKMSQINKETYIVYDLPITSHDLTDALRMANNFLLENLDFLNKLKQTGGRSDYYLTIEQKGKFVFEIPPELFKDCSDLGITLGVEIYPEG
jgi:hypothetical protein